MNHTSSAPTRRVRPVIAQSWDRCARYGLDAKRSMTNLSAREVDSESALAVAARPVLDALAVSLTEAGYQLVLADKSGRIIEQFGTSTQLRDRFEACSVRTGVDFSEEAVGTNAIGTAIEVGEPVAIATGEHFNAALSSISCIGQPLYHPITHALLGVIDLSGDESVTHPVVPPLVRDAARAIEQRVLDASSRRQQRLLAAFRCASPRSTTAIIALDDELLLANRPALDLLGGPALDGLRALVGRGGNNSTLRLPLAGDRVAHLRIEQVVGTRDGVVVRVEGLQDRDTANLPDAKPACDGAVLVCGPPGSGRSTAAARLGEGRPLVTVPADLALDDGSAWRRALHEAWRRDRYLVCIEEIGLLPEPLLSVLATLLDRSPTRPVVLTGPPLEELTGRAATLAARCEAHISLPALSERAEELPEIAQRLISRIAPGANLRLTPSVLKALAGQTWPGNLWELRRVLELVCRRRTSGDVTVGDLPPEYRTAPPCSLGGLARAERAAIVQALAHADGNKVKAARALGISRTTLYAQMRALSVPG